jgi:hypothetical protein
MTKEVWCRRESDRGRSWTFDGRRPRSAKGNVNERGLNVTFSIYIPSGFTIDQNAWCVLPVRFILVSLVMTSKERDGKLRGEVKRARSTVKENRRWSFSQLHPGGLRTPVV